MESAIASSESNASFAFLLDLADGGTIDPENHKQKKHSAPSIGQTY
jgi:hypothetical protein